MPHAGIMVLKGGNVGGDKSPPAPSNVGSLDVSYCGGCAGDELIKWCAACACAIDACARR